MYANLQLISEPCSLYPRAALSLRLTVAISFIIPENEFRDNNVEDISNNVLLMDMIVLLRHFTR